MAKFFQSIFKGRPSYLCLVAFVAVAVGFVMFFLIPWDVPQAPISSSHTSQDEGLREFIYRMPKAALHVHLEGTFEPELAFRLANRNQIELGSKEFPYKTLDELKQAYNFENLGDFLDLYYAVAGVLLKEDDFYQLASAYVSKMKENNILVGEIFFDPQTHTSRGIPFSTVIRGIQRAFSEAEKDGLKVSILMSFLRDAPVGNRQEMESADPYSGVKKKVSAWETLGQFLKYNRDNKDQVKVLGVALDSYEKPFPPDLFTEVFRHAESQGLFAAAHAGEEGPPQYVWDVLKLLRVSRIDHGVRSAEDPALVKYLSQKQSQSEILRTYGEPHQIPITVCPLSNFKLKVFPDPKESNIISLMNMGLLVTVNSDDPAYFGGYASDNYLAIIEWLNPSIDELHQLARNGFQGTWMSQDEKKPYLDMVDRYFGKTK